MNIRYDINFWTIVVAPLLLAAVIAGMAVTIARGLPECTKSFQYRSFVKECAIDRPVDDCSAAAVKLCETGVIS